MENNLEYRMYGLVPYNLSPIQQGIQFGHAVVEYMINFPMDLKIYNDTKKWAREDKTFIILNGGTTNSKEYRDQDNIFTDGRKFFGSLNNHLKLLKSKNMKAASFYEPDLGDQLTAIVFLVDERVWDKVKYPDFVPTNGLISSIKYQPGYKQWVDSVGGPQNAWLREFLKQFRLA